MARQVLPLTECFADVEDPRIERTKLHSLVDIICLSVLAVIAGAEGWEDIEDFGNQQQAWLQHFCVCPMSSPGTT